MCASIKCVCECVDCGVRGGLQEADPLTKNLHSISDLYEYMGTSQAEWESRSRGEVFSEGRGWCLDHGGISKMDVRGIIRE